MSDLIERLKNKLSYYIYKTVNDDDANKYAEEQKHKEPAKEPVTTEQYDDTAKPVAKSDATPSTDASTGVSITGIITQVWEYTLLFIEQYFFTILSLFLACYVANDLMMYSAAIRVIFFVFTLIVCISSSVIASGLALFYGGKKIYEKYLNRERDDKPNPPIKLMPKIFAILPITTYEPENIIGRFLLYPFRYLKEETLTANSNGNIPKPQKELLEDIMATYKKSLSESFPYYETVKGQAPFIVQKKEMDKLLDKMHEKKVKPIIQEENEEKKQYIDNAITKKMDQNKQPLGIDERKKVEENAGKEYNTKKKTDANAVENKKKTERAEAEAGPAEMSQAQKNMYLAKQKEINNAKEKAIANKQTEAKAGPAEMTQAQKNTYLAEQKKINNAKETPENFPTGSTINVPSVEGTGAYSSEPKP